MKKTFFVLFPVLVVVVAFTNIKVGDRYHPGPIITPSVKNRIDASLKGFIDSSKTMGLSALIFEKGKEVYFNAYGYADKEANKPMDRKTVVRIFSMTKPIVGVALMTLYEQGKFQLDDPLSKYAPEFADMKVLKGADANGNPILEPAKRPITVRDITRHTAGFAGGGNAVLGAMWRKADIMNLNNTLKRNGKKVG